MNGTGLSRTMEYSVTRLVGWYYSVRHLRGIGHNGRRSAGLERLDLRRRVYRCLALSYEESLVDTI